MSKPEPRTQQLSEKAWSFGDFTLDLRRSCLLRQGQEVKLRPKSFETLRYLVENHGRVVTKAELIEAVWPDSFVTDDSLVQCLRDVRRALDDQQQRYVKTVPRRGYIFDLAVHTLPAASNAIYEEEDGLRIIVEQRDDRAPSTRRMNLLTMAAVIVAVVSIAGGVYFYNRSVKLNALNESIARAEELAESGSYFNAYDLAIEALRQRPKEQKIAALMPLISDDLSVHSEPAGGRVYLKRISSDNAGASSTREFIGTSPISHLRIARGEYVLHLEKDGYASVDRSISSELNRVEHWLGVSPEIHVQVKFTEADSVPDNMVLVPGGEHQLLGWGQPTQATARLDDYFIDRYEVSNRDYKEFILAGGYLNKQLWKHTFLRDGREISSDEAMKEFKDRTGLPGPRNWSGGEFPDGKAEHPVTDITWYEAAAYAEFRGKQLPTVFQWENAARGSAFSHFIPYIMPWGASAGEGSVRRANLQGTGTVDVHEFEFGMSPYGCYQMAGNASEWSLNAWGDGFITLGGSYADPPYIFGDYGRLAGFYSSDKVGFRCVRNSLNQTSDQGAMRMQGEEESPSYAPTSEASFKTWLPHYRYDKTPIEGEVVESVETPEWLREKILYAGADDERAMAYLYLPRNAQPPFQVIQYVPGGSSFSGYRTTEGLEFGVFAPHIRLGRAVMVMILKGCVERPRPPDYKRAESTTVIYRERMIRMTIDVRRGFDYLQTRSDIDSSRVALMGLSMSSLGTILAAVEPRYRSVVFLAFGVYRSDLSDIAEANPIFFASHIRAPKLMLNGRYDEDFPFKSAAEPLFRLLPEPKRLELFEGGHCPPAEVSVPAVKRWLDETLGDVRYQQIPSQ